MDLTNFETSKFADVGSVMPVRNPESGDPLMNSDDTPMTITMYGTDGDNFRRARLSKMDRRLKMKRNREPTAVDLENDALDIIAAAVKDWNVTIEDIKPPCTHDNVRSAFVRFPWLRKQVDEWMAGEANFTRAS